MAGIRALAHHLRYRRSARARGADLARRAGRAIVTRRAIGFAHYHTHTGADGALTLEVALIGAWAVGILGAAAMIAGHHTGAGVAHVVGAGTLIVAGHAIAG